MVSISGGCTADRGYMSELMDGNETKMLRARVSEFVTMNTVVAMRVVTGRDGCNWAGVVVNSR